MAVSPIIGSFNWFALSDQGRRRTNNEDSWGAFALEDKAVSLAAGRAGWPQHGALLVVSDGMGGARAGEEASRFCVEQLPAELQARRSAAPETAMRDAFVATHEALFAQGEADAAKRGMGATLTAVWLRTGGELVLGHIGDSRAYLLRGREIRQLSEDHSVGAGMVRRGELTPEAASRLRFRSLLEQAMGGDGAPITPQVLTTRWESGDMLLLCSDGLYGPLRDELTPLLSDFAGVGSLETTAKKLIDAANEAGGPDNITVLLARLLP